jgi:hypothetical protein
LKIEGNMAKTILYTLFLGSFLLASCAFDLAHVSFSPTTCAAAKVDKSFKIKETTEVSGTPCWHTRVLSKGTVWNLFGYIPEGEVYKSRDQVLTVECSNIHEAHLVISGGTIVGLYLPVEKGFVALSKPIALNIE